MLRLSLIILRGAESILQWILPLSCRGCGRHVEKADWPVCEVCMKQLPLTEHAHYRANEVERMFVDDKKFVRGGAYSYYYRESVIHKLLIEMKFHQRPEIGEQLGRRAAEAFMKEHFFDGIDVIIPLPLHPIRLRERGYNQAEYIARGISAATGISVDTEHLIRAKNNDKQSMQKWSDRVAAKQMFALKNEQNLRGKHVLLVDDIVTSGTTLKHAMTLLHGIRNTTYSVMTLGYAHRPNVTDVEMVD